jgi:7,8-dihydroneopterin aldolase/epimerase/oxygenase
MVEINLTGAEFFAHHGFYPEEQLLGGRFLLDISVSFLPSGDLIFDEINNTVNYEQLYNIACDEMNNTRKLIETVAQSICDRIKEEFPFVVKIRVCLQKMNPPLKGKVAHSSVVVTNE